MLKSIFARFLLLALGLAASGLKAAEQPAWVPKTYLASSNEFDTISAAVVKLLQTHDAAGFALAVTPSVEDWKSVTPANLPATGNDPFKGFASYVPTARHQIEDAAKALLARADALHLDFSKGNLHSKVEPVKNIGSIRYSEAEGNDGLPYAQKMEIVLTNSAGPKGDFTIIVLDLTKFPGGWRVGKGLQWEQFPSGLLEDKDSRDLLLLNKIAAGEGLTGRDDPALLKLGESLIHLVRDRDLAAYEKEALVNSDEVWAWVQKQAGGHAPSRKDLDTELAKQRQDQIAGAKSLLALMDQAGVDLKNAHVQIKEVALERAQPQSRPASMDGVAGQRFKLLFTVSTDARARNGTPLSGDYALAVGMIMRLDGNWKIMQKLYWRSMPPGVIDKEASAAMELENYVGEHGTLPSGQAAPNISFTTLDGGKKLSLANFSGKVVVLDFWATWCGPCQEPMAKLQSLKQEHPEWKDGAVIIPLSIDDTIDLVRAHVNKRGWTNTFNVWAGEGGWHSVPAQAFRVTGVPTTYIIDAKGKIVTAGHPAGMDIGHQVGRLIKIASSSPR